MRPRSTRSLGLMGAALALGCTSPVSDEAVVPTISLVVVSGNSQAAPAGTELPSPLVVKVTDNLGKVLKGYLVTFRVNHGGGRMFIGTGLTDARGITQDYWTLGPTPGVQQVDVVAVDQLTGVRHLYGVFTATALVPTPIPSAR